VREIGALCSSDPEEVHVDDAAAQIPSVKEVFLLVLPGVEKKMKSFWLASWL
jgi:hypothetical protein